MVHFPFLFPSVMCWMPLCWSSCFNPRIIFFCSSWSIFFSKTTWAVRVFSVVQIAHMWTWWKSFIPFNCKAVLRTSTKSIEWGTPSRERRTLSRSNLHRYLPPLFFFLLGPQFRKEDNFLKRSRFVISLRYARLLFLPDLPDITLLTDAIAGILNLTS